MQLGLKEAVHRAVVDDRSGSITMEILMKLPDGSAEIPNAELVAGAAWYIWWQRPQRVKGIEGQTLERTALSIRVLATNYIRSISPKMPSRKDGFMWKKPSHGVVKINVDASFHGDTLSGEL